MICPDCGYNMVKDDSEYGYSCVVCEPKKEVSDEDEDTE